MFARSRWLFKGIDNGDIKELFLGSSLPLTSKMIFGIEFGGGRKNHFFERGKVFFITKPTILS